jgi:hypothetical protein
LRGVLREVQRGCFRLGIQVVDRYFLLHAVH